MSSFLHFCFNGQLNRNENDNFLIKGRLDEDPKTSSLYDYGNYHVKEKRESLRMDGSSCHKICINIFIIQDNSYFYSLMNYKN